MSLDRVRHVQPLQAHALKLTFDDGLVAIIPLRLYIGKGLTAELLDTAKFEEVGIEPGGGIAWPNGFDLCPQFLRELAENRQAVA